MALLTAAAGLAFLGALDPARVELAGICVELPAPMPIPGKSDGSRIGCVDTDTVPDSIPGDLLFGRPVGLVALPAIDGIAGFRPDFVAERNGRLELVLFTSNGDWPALRGFGAMPDCALLRGRVLRMPGLVF